MKRVTIFGFHSRIFGGYGMSMDIQSKPVVKFEADAVRIEGKPQILLCASLFYFRIPRAYWKERMEQLKAFGYNSIDVYFPWNYHEREEGVWDFSGERDVGAFLAAAAEVGLWVIARPGPYICSEWDGGALPAYLLASGAKLRDNDPVYLRSAASWFDRIIPLLKAHQIGEGGTVAAVQLDNELDFYDCADPAGYIAALRDMALERGITVPLFACAGQGGLPQASGFADQVVPTCNFYPDNRDPEFERKVLHYGELLGGLGYPLLVTETNRAHYLLRRLLACGAKLLGPYLQVSGTDFGFTNATNNWGKPLAFLTSDYDFGGMISPEGHIREEAYEGRLLGRLLAAYGSSLAEAKPASCGSQIEGDSEGVGGPYALELKGGGSLVFVTNLDDRDKELVLATERAASDEEEQDKRSTGSPFTLRGGRSLALPVQVPLTGWGMRGVLACSTGELYMARTTLGGSALAFHTDGPGEIELQLEDGYFVAEEAGLQTEHLTDGLRIRFEGDEPALCTIRLGDGSELKLHVHDREHALLAESLDDIGDLSFGRRLRYEMAEEEAASELRLSAASDPAQPPASAIRRDVNAASARPLEVQGVYRGFAWYEATVPLTEQAGAKVKGLLVSQASDVVSLYADGAYAGTAAPGGSSRYFPLAGLREGRVAARAEIWGHTNFDDARLPALRLNAMKGMTGITAITAVRDLSRNWSVYRAKNRTIRSELTGDADRSLWPVVVFGGWLSPDHPAFEYYSRTFEASAEASSWTLYFEGLQSHAKVFVNGVEAAENVNPFDPYVDITPFVTAGQAVTLTIFVERVLGLPATDKVVLFEGVPAADWTISSAEEQELIADAADKLEQSAQIELPAELAPGRAAWLYAAVAPSGVDKGWRVQFDGKGLKLTVFLEDRIVGRLWLPCDAELPLMTGGSRQSVYLPGAWFPEAGEPGRLAIWLEAVETGSPGALHTMTFRSV